MLVVVGCVLGCAYQCIAILNLFFSFPSIVFVYVTTMDQLELPGVTLCNSNRVMMSKLREFNKTFDKIWSTYDDTNDVDDDNVTKLDKQQIVDDTIRALLNTLTVNDFMKLGHTVDEFLVPEYFRCATDSFHLDDKCRKYADILTTGQEVGNCWTLFHKSNSSDYLKDMAIQSGLSQSPVIRGHGEAVDLELADQPFHPNEILRLKINFSAGEYTTLNDEVFGHFIVHDENQLPPIREKNFYIYPGYYYEFFILKQSDQLLPKPFATDCIDYYLMPENQSQSDDHNEYLNHPLSRENCIIGCMAQNTMDKCNCWPPELPFLKGSAVEAIENSMKWCDWNTGPQLISKEAIAKKANDSWFKFCFTEHEKQCNDRCKLDCHLDRYTIIQQKRDWPAKERIEHSKHADSLMENHKCCSTVSLRYWSAEHTINKYESKYEISEFIAYLGGLLSMWLGFSLVRTYNVIEFVSIRLCQKRAEQKLRSKLESKQSNYDHNIAYLHTTTTNGVVKPSNTRRTNHKLHKWHQIKPKVSNLLTHRQSE
ncbi:acid-sensing ion channel 1C-like [Oppia nitens]|uniref:acid-sensing ion channel 1C-like n=1 Tax=Oppia nitens TaxID=1686743 RepID=UPI0023DBD38E|nr:acid-sensing ion channel 1C-like [Oppia nitens]